MLKRTNIVAIGLMMAFEPIIAATSSQDFQVASIASTRQALTKELSSNGYRASPVMPDVWIKDIGGVCQMTMSAKFSLGAKQPTVSVQSIAVGCGESDDRLAAAALVSAHNALTH